MDKADWRLVGWWALLVALTIGSLETSLQRGPTSLLVIPLIVIACLKIRVVVLHFMEVADAPWPLRAPLELWVVAIGAAILLVWFNVAP